MPTNPEVNRLLQFFTNETKGRNFCYIAAVMIDEAGMGIVDHGGRQVSCELALNGAKLLVKQIETYLENWKLPAQDPSLDESYVVYNMANGAIGFDFFTWLVDAEMRRIRCGAPPPLKVAFWRGRDTERIMAANKRYAWLDNVFRPGLQLLDAIEDHRAIAGHRSTLYMTKDVVAAARNGEKVPMMGSPLGDKPGNYMTITLREASHFSYRNSNVDGWVRFAERLKAEGETVFFIRDTEKADEPIAGFETLPRASRNLLNRAGIYYNAKMNFFVSNGPSMLCVYSKAPWMTMIPIEPDESEYFANTQDFWREMNGVEPPGQYPWTRSDQRIIWEVDTFDNIVAGWEKMKENVYA